MITYIVSGPLPDVWKDFVSINDNCKNISITSNGDRLYTSCSQEGISDEFYEDSDDEWIDYYIVEKEITEKKAKEILATVNNTVPENIELQYSEISYQYNTDISVDIITTELRKAEDNLNDMIEEENE